MTQYIVAYDEENFKSPVSVYDTEASDGDLFSVQNNANIHSYFTDLYAKKAEDGKMPSSGGLVMVTETDLDNLSSKYPVDEEVASLVAAVMEAIDQYPDKVYYYTFE